MEIQTPAYLILAETGIIHQATLAGNGRLQNWGYLAITGAPPSVINLELENQNRLELVKTPSLQLNGTLWNQATMALVNVDFVMLDSETTGRIVNAGTMVIPNNTTLALVRVQCNINTGRVYLGTGSVMQVAGNNSLYDHFQLVTSPNSFFVPVGGDTSRCEGVFSSTGPGTVLMQTGRLMCAYAFRTDTVFRLEGGGFQWEGGRIDVAPGYKLENQGLFSVLHNKTNPAGQPFILAGILENCSTMRIANVHTMTLTVAGPYDLFNAATGQWHFIGESPAISSSGFFRNSGDVVFAMSETCAINCAFFHYTGTLTFVQGQANLSGLVLQGGQTLLNGGNWQGDSVFILGGTLGGNGRLQGATFHSSGRLSPGTSPGRLFADGRYTQTGTGELFLELAGAQPGLQFDQLAVASNAALGGLLTVALLDGYDPPPRDPF